MFRPFIFIVLLAGVLWAQDFNKCQTLQALQTQRTAFEKHQSGALKNENIPDSTRLHLIAVYESYVSRLYPVMENELRRKDGKKHFKRIYEKIQKEREEALAAINRLCTGLQGNTVPRICKAAQKYFSEQQFRQDIKTKPAPDFGFTDITGKKGALSDFRDSYVLLHFWSMHSVPCVQELQDLKKIHTRYGKRLQIISINTDPVGTNWDKETLINFIQTMQLNWTHIADGSSKRIFNLFHVHNYPTLYLLDPKGKAVHPDFKLGKELLGERLFKTLAQLLGS